MENMMIPSYESIEKMYEAGISSFGIFDRRILLPVEQVAMAVEAETGAKVSESNLHEFAADGWYAPLPLPWDPSARGVPLFIPSRIGLLLDLQARGYGRHELRSFAAWEDYWIDNFGDLYLDYEDDDVKLLLRDLRDRYASAESRLEFSKESVELEHAKEELESARIQISKLEKLRGNPLPPSLQERIKRAAFFVRALEEGIRVTFVEKDRAQCRAGFSPFVYFHRYEWSAARGHVFGSVDWYATLSSPWIEECSIGIRVPEFLFDYDRVTTVKPLIPSAYRKAWVERNLDGYFEALAKLRGEQRCLHCQSLLAKDRNSRQRYCSDPCRSAAKQRRLRANNPDSVFNAQSRYYQSLSFDEEKDC
jgi:hypothetical protein